MIQLVADAGIIVQACLPEQGESSVRKLFVLARNNSLTLWAHPQTVTEALGTLGSSLGGRAVQMMSELLETVRLLPTPAAQYQRALRGFHEEVETGSWSASDLTAFLSLFAAREYLDECLFVGLGAGRTFPGHRVLDPDECLALLDGEPGAETVSFVDLKAQQHAILPAVEDNLFHVVKSCQFILGPDVHRLEHRLGEYVQCEHVVSCSSGTEALVLALMALNIGPGDAVFTTPFTFIATAGAICQVGAVPVFVDIEQRTFNIDPDRLESAIVALSSAETGYPLPREAKSLCPRAVITVDLFGLPADSQRISRIAERFGLAVIEDAAQSFGGQDRGRKTCSLGDIGCTSFFPAKPLGAYGEGGACFTSNQDLAEAMRSIRVHGQGASRYEHGRLGTNARLDSMQAAVLLAKLDAFPTELELRAEKAAAYTELLAGANRLLTPHVPEGFASAWAQYSLLADEDTLRDEYRQALHQGGVPTMIYYPIPLHLQRVFAYQGYGPGDFPVAEHASRHIFSLPMHPYLERGTQERIASILCRAAQAA